MNHATIPRFGLNTRLAVLHISKYSIKRHCRDERKYIEDLMEKRRNSIAN